MKNSDASPPGHHCANNTANVENVVGIPKVVKYKGKAPFWPPQGKNTGATCVDRTPSKENPSRERPHILILHVKTQVD